MKLRKLPDQRRMCVLRPKDAARAEARAAELANSNISADQIFDALLRDQPHTLVGLITDTGKQDLQQEKICDLTGIKVFGPIVDGDVVGVYEAVAALGISIGEEFEIQ